MQWRRKNADYRQGMMQWFEKEDFWINFAPIMFDEKRWAEAPTVAEYVKKIAGLKDGDTVLDAGCGLGRISVELALLNLDVTGIDIIQAELDAAKESADDEGVSLTLLNTDLRTYKTDKKFDCVVNLYTSFGYCDTIEEDMMILENMARAVKEGGTFIMECTSRETAIMYWTDGEIFERAGYKVQTEFKVTGAWEGLSSRWMLFSPDTPDTKLKSTKPLIDHTFIQRLYPASFLCDRLLSYGLKEVSIHGDFDLSPYNEHARTMIIVGRK